MLHNVCDSHYEYIRPKSHDCEVDFNFVFKDEIIIPKAPIYYSLEVLNGIVKFSFRCIL